MSTVTGPEADCRSTTATGALTSTVCAGAGGPTRATTALTPVKSGLRREK